MGFSQEIINVLNYLCQKFGIVIDWTSENVMPYLEELCGRYIQYEIYTSIAWCVTCGIIVVLIGLVWAISAIVEHCNRYRSDTPEVFRAFFFVSLAICIIVCAVQAFDIIECHTLPEKTILEYLRYLMNSSSR